jgi:hypothetical protein
MKMTSATLFATVIPALLLVSALPSCKENKPGTGLVVLDAATTAPVEAGAVDMSQCVGCQAGAAPAWTFEGIYRDPACTVPIAQAVPTACTPIPALGPATLTYVDDVLARKAGEVASVTMAEQITPETARFSKAGTKCVRANEGGVDVTPAGCSGSRVCRDSTGALSCTSCRTLANGCSDYEDTRMYATFTDPGLTGAKTAAPGGNLAALRQCCAALSTQAKTLGASPEAGMIVAAAAQCTALVNSAGPTGNVPEVGALRGLLAGRNVPAVCAGF